MMGHLVGIINYTDFWAIYSRVLILRDVEGGETSSFQRIHTELINR